MKLNNENILDINCKGRMDSQSSDCCLPDLLRQQADKHPDTTAICSGDRCLTFRELVDSSTCVALYMQHLGIAADARVGIFVEPSLDLMVGVWGTLFAGGAYLPLSPEYPEERLCYMIEHACVQVIFSQEKLRKKLSELAPQGTKIVTLENVAAFVTSTKASVQFMPQTNLRSDNLAYIIYTSGSTGKPKGVMIEHCSIVNQMRWMNEKCGLNEEKIVLQKTPMSFDAAQWEILAPACGSTVIMGYPEIYRDTEGLIDTIIRNNVTTLQCVPTLLQALLDTDAISGCHSLTQIFSGGEALSRQLAQQCLTKFPNCDLINLYGPTECTINASAFVVNCKTLNDGPNSISIGTPVSNTQFYVLDENYASVPNGELGELYIGGVQLARGYLHQPQMTAERFIDVDNIRLYKTGDLACRNADGTYQFKCRADNQVKLRGFRIELDEIRLAIERHDWVKNAAVLTSKDERTNFQHLIAYIELSPKEAVLMDQSIHGAHHQSKASRLQVKAQLSNMGCRGNDSICGKTAIDLPCKTPSKKMREVVFARKTYRFYEGGPVNKGELEQLLSLSENFVPSRNPNSLSFNEFGEILRYFGQFLSNERLLPKYGYASPGALYATQMYIEVGGTPYLRPGYYYYHPVHHQLILISKTIDATPGSIKIHFIGKKQAIEPVYKTNINEVLEIETGHMLGLFDAILPAYGLSVGKPDYTPDVIKQLECNNDDCYLATCQLTPYAEHQEDTTSLDIYVQSHPGKIADMPAGQYHYDNGCLNLISDDLIQKKHVIAINQRVYERASFGITVVSKNSDQFSYIALGRKLQQLQMNDLNLGFMSAGYSSKSDHDLPSAKRIAHILGNCNMQSGPSYFFVGGRVSDEQWQSEGMKEDTVHMKGPAEMIKEDLATMLPEYMVPKRVVVLDKLPLTANAKIDTNALKALAKSSAVSNERLFVPPRTPTEERISEIWQNALQLEAISIEDDFFECGGNSLIAVSMVHQINREFKRTLPLQIIFEAPTIQKLACLVNGKDACCSSRLVPLNMEGSGKQQPIYCWPGLGGYPMNLRSLANQHGLGRPFYGVQAHGINENETPFKTIKEMAAEDIKEIKCIQPSGPYTLWGYSFGARVAFETAFQLEQAGDKVEHLFLIAPGAPKVQGVNESMCDNNPTFDNRAFVTILFSVFAGTITGPALDECLAVARDESSFVSFINTKFPHLHSDLVRRIVRIVRQTYEFKYTFIEFAERRLSAPITIFKAQGDDYSFIEETVGFLAHPPSVVDLKADHYNMLKNSGIDELVRSIRGRLDNNNKSIQSEVVDKVCDISDNSNRRRSLKTLRKQVSFG